MDNQVNKQRHQGLEDAVMGAAMGTTGSYHAAARQQKIEKESEFSKAARILHNDEVHRSLAADQVLMLKMVMPSWGPQMVQLSEGLYSWFKHQGFWPSHWEDTYSRARRGTVIDGPPETVTIPVAEYVRLKKTEKLALIVTEVAETIEAVRKDDFQNELEELSDIQVRFNDYLGGFRLQHQFAGAFTEKMVANYGRPFKHGKEF
jgi:hypothetical protein